MRGNGRSVCLCVCACTFEGAIYSRTENQENDLPGSMTKLRPEPRHAVCRIAPQSRDMNLVYLPFIVVSFVAVPLYGLDIYCLFTFFVLHR